MTRASIDWPVGFAPEILTCSHSGHMAALARAHGSGVLMAPTGTMEHQALQQFSFRGIDQLGEILGSHWGQNSMLLTMRSGHLAECEGLPVQGAWTCEHMGSRLPLGGSSLRKAVVARVP